MSVALFHRVSEQIERGYGPLVWPSCVVRRLAVLVTGLVAAQTTVLAKVASEVLALGITGATLAESVERGLRRTLSDGRLDAHAYQQTLGEAVDWDSDRRSGEPVVLALDESSQDDRIHLVRLALPYWGGSVAVAWALWEQNQPLPAGMYWPHLEAVLAAAAVVIPADLSVVVTADRAYDIPAFLDRVAAVGWHWWVRAKARSDLRYRDQRGHETALRDQVRTHLPHPGTRWKGRGQVFKAAGWRAARVVGVWATGHQDPLVVLTDLPARWQVLRVYDRRYWIEPGFRADKTAGWGWEDSGVVGVAHQQVVVLAMAWASLLMMVVGVTEAQERLDRLRSRPLTARRSGWWGRGVERAKHAVFTLGLRRIHRWLVRALPDGFTWRLPYPIAPAWNHQWRHAQIARNLAGPSVRP